ncbi:exonuclease V [Aspergillus candidus]|uniref:Uncharacterized protein n=1 Tax=Aspergillus candidus TaxID=41067 RepID=A0A2I2F0H0_ASPCN|nr:hypothetical protein BDW47DRAFT_112724 [Aspergillus candidus]PLB34123.1 hypothetical protein BDW47DRAFT_112724 [Aspergillus candidus]
MSCPPLSPTLMPGAFDDCFDASSVSGSSSEYGFDFTPEEETLLDELLTNAVAEHATAPAIIPRQPFHHQLQQQHQQPQLHPPTAPIAVTDIEQCHEVVPERVPRVLGREMPPWQAARFRRSPDQGPYGGAAIVEHPNSTEGRERDRERQRTREQDGITTTTDAPTEPDTRSPVERFRRPPNKAFSVTDLISPAWCELQYWYTLTKFGRKRRTAAMKTGSTIHKTLEDEIYTTVSVEITTREDALALRILNVIQGLRMLREYGITRELEVWGVVDGELVNGVIDQLSYECPDPELEATAASYYADVEASRDVMPEYQMSLSDYLLSPTQGGKRLSDVFSPDEAEQQQSSLDEAAGGSSQSEEAFNLPRVYMTDVKTRNSKSVPTVKSSSFRPTLLQLQIYYHMLNRMVTSDDVSIEMIAARYDLDPERRFTVAFINEVGGLNDQFFDALSSSSPEVNPDSSPSGSSQDSTSILLTHSNLTQLWGFMKDQLRLTFLLPPPSQSSSSPSPPISSAPSIPSEFQPRLLESYATVISPLLTARYLSSTPADDDDLQPRVLGSRSFLFDPTSMMSYLTDQMEWWRGQRAPRGVEVMDAWKCRICEFNDECTWRQEREWAYARRNRGRSASRVV